MKRTIRKEIRERIAQMTETERISQSFSVCKKIVGLQEWQQSSDVMLYAAMSDELSLSLLFDDALSNGKTVWLPVVDGENLIIRQYIEGKTTKDGVFAIEEPTEDAPELPISEENAISLMIVPGRAFTLSGDRLGRGKGYYDRLFAQENFAHCKKIGVAYRCQIYDSIPTDSWDTRMDLIVTD